MYLFKTIRLHLIWIYTVLRNGVFTEAKDTNKNDLPMDHHQHNGNLKLAVSPHPDGPEKSTSLEVSQNDKLQLQSSDAGKSKTIPVDNESKAIDLELACPDDNQNNQDDNNKESTDEYEHSLCKWPSGRSWISKVSWNYKIVQRIQLNLLSNIKCYRYLFSDYLDCYVANSSSFPVYDSRLRETTVQEMVSFDFYYVYCLDWFAFLHGSLDDYCHW